jgi:hypothetical protein
VEIVGKEEFDKVEAVSVQPKLSSDGLVVGDEEFKVLLEKMQSPVEAQKEMAAKIKFFLDKRIEKEMGEKGYLSDFLRRWVKDYNEILDRIQKSLYGDKSVNLHLFKVSNSDVAAKIRKHAGGGDVREKVISGGGDGGDGGGDSSKV